MFVVDPQNEPIVTPRLNVTALTVDDADEMVDVLGDERLHEFIGGRPLDLDELRHRYRGFVAGSGEPAERWLNWIVRTRDGVAVGTMQATVSTTDPGRSTADVAWVIGVGWQGVGYAGEAACAVVDWLASHGVDDRVAPDRRRARRRDHLAPPRELVIRHACRDGPANRGT